MERAGERVPTPFGGGATFERELLARGRRVVVGADEAGRGAIAGPLCAAAVLCDIETLLADGRLRAVRDSKALDHGRRRRLAPAVLAGVIDFSVVIVPACAVDARGVQRANLEALERAIRSVLARADAADEPVVVIDHYRIPGTAWIGLTHGDSLSRAVAAASVLAKCVRDAVMAHLAELYPGYGLERHRGYGTREHADAVKDLGLSEIHRSTFCLRALEPKLF